jgi:hypothetical protein
LPLRLSHLTFLGELADGDAVLPLWRDVVHLGRLFDRGFFVRRFHFAQVFSALADDIDGTSGASESVMP